MKTAVQLLGVAAFLSMAAGCAARTEPTENQGAQSSNVDGKPVDPSAPVGPAPAPAPTPAPAPACSPLPTPAVTGAGVANPASVYCAALGYGAAGEDCTFLDGTSCEQWSFYRGECGQAHSFCNLHGGSVANKVEDMGGWTASYALCTLSDGKQCQEDEFAHSCGCK